MLWLCFVAGLWTCSWVFELVVGALSSLRGFGLATGAENSYRGRWPSATFFMRLLVVALFSSRGFGLVVGAFDLWLGH